jgi:xanthine dehydrogenase/oxidase
MICRVNILDKNYYLSENGIRYVTMDHTFFTGYRRTVVKPDEVLVSITIPYTKEVS